MFIGTAGWNIPKDFAPQFPPDGSHLQRYSKILNAVEINSSFYREHLASSYTRWSEMVPGKFKFSVKLSQTFTHQCGFKPKVREVHASLDRILHLGDKLGVILIQLPGSLEFKAKDAERFYKILRKKYQGPLVLEPRNSGWISNDSQNLMKDYEISKVIADPERCVAESKAQILKAGGLTYYRLHGSPVVYKSLYAPAFIKKLALEIMSMKNVWCIFDNTTFGHGVQNALELKSQI